MKLEKTDFIEKYVQYCIEMEKAMKKMIIEQIINMLKD